MKNKTKTQPKAKYFIKGASDKLIKNYKLDGAIVIAAKGDEINVDVVIPGRLVPRFLKSLENTSERIMMSSIEHIIGSLIKKTKKK